MSGTTDSSSKTVCCSHYALNCISLAMVYQCSWIRRWALVIPRYLLVWSSSLVSWQWLGSLLSRLSSLVIPCTPLHLTLLLSSTWAVSCQLYGLWMINVWLDSWSSSLWQLVFCLWYVSLWRRIVHRREARTRISLIMFTLIQSMYKRDVSLRVRYEYNVRITFFVRFVYERLKERYLTYSQLIT